MYLTIVNFEEELFASTCFLSSSMLMQSVLRAGLLCQSGAVPSGEPNSPGSVDRVRKWISEKYDAAQLTRPLTTYDKLYLEAKAYSDCSPQGAHL